jgi:hypothetical protein
MKILFKFASRSRPKRFFDTLDNIHSMVADKDNYHVVCTLDLDDPTMYNEEIMRDTEKYSNTTLMYGLSKSKIDAFNRDMEELTGWDIVVAMSDDMRFIIYGFDNLIREGFQYNAPDLDALLHYPDNDAKHMIPVLYIAGRKYFERDLYIYNPIYWSLFCDNESMHCAQIRNKYFFMGIQIVNHLNPAYGHLPRDDQFDKQQGMWGRDERIFNIRKANNFGLLV